MFFLVLNGICSLNGIEWQKTFYDLSFSSRQTAIAIQG